MVKRKQGPRLQAHVLGAGGPIKSNNFFYRLISSQRFLAIIGLIFLLLIIFPLARTYTQKRMIENEIDGVKKEISDFEKSNQELRDMITYLQSDQSLEEQARLNLNLKKPGEKVIVIEEPKLASSSDYEKSTTADETNLAKWWRYFFD